ncbi:Uncharacterised protein [uncultured archaeon]|nr:Uncharacterised protein [uncultured archaeon]
MPGGGASGVVVHMPTSDVSMPGVRSVAGVIVSGGSTLVAATTLNRMIWRVFGPKPGVVIVGFLGATGK